MTRLLGIDLGERRIGIAIGDDGEGGFARGLVTVRRGSPERDAQLIEQLCAEHGAAALVVGLPLRLDGTEGPQAELTRAWAAGIADRLGLPIAWRDERLTSVAAEIDRRPDEPRPQRRTPDGAHSRTPPCRRRPRSRSSHPAGRARRSRRPVEPSCHPAELSCHRADGAPHGTRDRSHSMTIQRGRGATPMPDPERGTRSRTVRNGAMPQALPLGSRRRRTGGAGPKGLLFVGVIAAVVLLGLSIVLGPIVNGFARGLAEGNPELMRIGFVGDAVKQQLGADLTEPISKNPTGIPFEVAQGDTRREVGSKLTSEGFIKRAQVYDYWFVKLDHAGKLKAGTFTINKAMPPEQIATRLAGNPDPPKPKMVIGLRESLRLEQITALLASGETQDKGLMMDAQAFYDLASKPTDAIRNDYEFLSTLPAGRSLEGFLGSGTFSVDPDIEPEAFVRMLLDAWGAENGDTVAAAKDAGKDFYEVLTLASIVEKEAGVDEERAKIAGVYINRIATPRGPTVGLLQADPTVFYAYDSGELRKKDLSDWPLYAFNNRPQGLTLADMPAPDDLKSFQTYQNKGLPDGPICTPTKASIEAALEPDTKDKFFFFVAKNDGSRTHAFAKTLAEHQRNVQKYQR